MRVTEFASIDSTLDRGFCRNIGGTITKKQIVVVKSKTKLKITRGVRIICSLASEFPNYSAFFEKVVERHVHKAFITASKYHNRVSIIS